MQDSSANTVKTVYVNLSHKPDKKQKKKQNKEKNNIENDKTDNNKIDLDKESKYFNDFKDLTDLNDKTPKKRVETQNWSFSHDYYKYENQMLIIQGIYEKKYDENDKIYKIAIQQINRKIYGYKQQDNIKNKFNEEKFLTFDSVIEKMVKCELKCYYCACEMNVLYDISREMKQWSVDRINNDLGHNVDNYYLACLECNLKRRRRSDEKFLFTKQMKLVKIPGGNPSSI